MKHYLKAMHAPIDRSLLRGRLDTRQLGVHRVALYTGGFFYSGGHPEGVRLPFLRQPVNQRTHWMAL